MSKKCIEVCNTQFENINSRDYIVVFICDTLGLLLRSDI